MGGIEKGKVKMRRELRKTLCVLMAAITLSSSIQLPVRASEPVGEVQETAAGEAALEPAKLAEETEQSVTDNASDAAQELSSLAEEIFYEQAAFVFHSPHRH